MDGVLSGWDPCLKGAEADLETGIEIGLAEGDGAKPFLRAERLLPEVLGSEPCHARVLWLRTERAS